MIPHLLLAATLAAQPITLTVHTPAGVRVVHGTFSALTFSAGAVTVDYTSDRIFCADFSAEDECWQVMP